MVCPDRSCARGRVARGAELDRLRARERDRLPHLHGGGARPVRQAVLQLPARANAEGPTRGDPRLAEGRIPGLKACIVTDRAEGVRTAPRERPRHVAARVTLRCVGTMLAPPVPRSRAWLRARP